MSGKPEALTATDGRWEAAADWLQRLDHPDLSEEELQAWLKWHDESEQNRRAFEDMQGMYRKLGSLSAEQKREMWRRVAPAPVVRRRRREWLRPLAAAAALLVGIGGAWWWMDAGNRVELTYEAPADRHRTVQLADGSALVLAQDSAVSVKYSSSLRLLTVQRGQAYFEVRHNARRPFVVQAGTVRVTAVGTAFNVARSEEDKVTVTVTEGVVDVVRVAEPELPRAAAAGVAPAEHLRVALGQRLVLGERPAGAARDGGAAEPGWHNGQVQFFNTPLRQVVKLISRDSPDRVVIDDPRVADLQYSGTIFRDHIDEWAAALPTIYPIRVVPMQDGGVALVSAVPWVGMR
jgi:transmembrane sensor